MSEPLIDIRPDHWAIVADILRRHVPDREVWAFGSRATWNAKEYSDLDLAVIGEAPLSLTVSAALTDDFAECDLPFKVDVVDWATTSEAFREVIRRDKVVVQRAAKHPVDGVAGETWSRMPLGEFVTLQRGHDLPDEQRRTGSVPIIGSFGITGWHDEARARGPGVTVGRSGASFGVVSYSPMDYWPLSTALYVIDFHGNAPRFAYYFLKQFDFKGFNSGSAQPSLNRNFVHPAPVDVPPLAEQRAIAHILGTLDHKIELNRRMSETLEAMARALFKSWFVDFGPVRAKAEGRDAGLPKPLADLFPARLVDSELGEIPEGWKVKTIGDLAEIVGGSTPSTKEPTYWDNGCHHWATPKDLSALKVPALLDTERRVPDAGLAQISSGLLAAGTVLLSSRAPIGYLAVSEIPVAINQGFIAMQPKKDVSNLFLLFWASFAHDEILSRANGSTFLEISKANFRPISAIAPPAKVMKAFDQQVRRLYERIVESERESRVLATLRDTLLPKLISGELRVKDAERQIAQAI